MCKENTLLELKDEVINVIREFGPALLCDCFRMIRIESGKTLAEFGIDAEAESQEIIAETPEAYYASLFEFANSVLERLQKNAPETEAEPNKDASN